MDRRSDLNNVRLQHKGRDVLNVLTVKSMYGAWAFAGIRVSETAPMRRNQVRFGIPLRTSVLLLGSFHVVATNLALLVTTTHLGRNSHELQHTMHFRRPSCFFMTTVVFLLSMMLLMLSTSFIIALFFLASLIRRHPDVVWMYFMFSVTKAVGLAFLLIYYSTYEYLSYGTIAAFFSFSMLSLPLPMLYSMYKKMQQQERSEAVLETPRSADADAAGQRRPA